MSFARSPVFVSILISVGLLALGIPLAPASGGRGAYSVLVFSETIPDKTICERLEKEGFSGLISESGQRVLLDSFGSMEQVPLDEYDSRVLSFDPRNDGYAEKLRSLFVQDDKRFIYIPQGGNPGGPFVPAKLAGVEQKLSAAMGEIPYSYFDARSFYSVTGRQVGLSFVLFCLAAAVFFIVGPLRRALRPHAVCLIPLLPALVPLCLGGAAGFVMASLLTGFAVLIAEPCLKRLGRSRVVYRRRRLLPTLMPPVFLTGYGALVFFSGIPLIFTLIVFVCFCGIFGYSLRIASRAGDAAAGAVTGAYADADVIISALFGGLFSRRQEQEHRRFSPILILKPRIPVYAFSWAMIPFAAAALAAALIGISASATTAASPVLPSAAAVTEADYQAHYRFQSAFSEMSLHSFHLPDAPGSGSAPESRRENARMSAYELASDGLSVIPAAAPSKQPALPAAPPFPLADLLRFLNSPR